VLAAQRKRLRDLASSSNYWLLEEEKQQTQKQKEMLTIMEQIERWKNRKPNLISKLI
jgi:SAM-dependent MidA family methyltransferase